MYSKDTNVQALDIEFLQQNRRSTGTYRPIVRVAIVCGRLHNRVATYT